MTLASDIAAELPYLRAEAESLMLDAGTAQRPTGGTVYQGGVDVGVYDDLFDSVCKVQSSNLVARESEVGARTSVSVRTELHLPALTAPLTTGDLFVVATPHPLSLVPADTVYRIAGPAAKSLATARRYEVEEVVS